MVALIEAAGGEAAFQRSDMTVEADVAALVAGAVTRRGRVDAAFSDAGHPGRLTSVGRCISE